VLHSAWTLVIVCSGGSLDDDHGAAVRELDANTSRLLVQLRVERPTLFAPCSVSVSAGVPGFGDEEVDDFGRAAPDPSTASPSRLARPPCLSGAATPTPPVVATPPRNEPASTTSGPASPQTVRRRSSSRGAADKALEEECTGLTRTLEAFTELPASSLSSWHIAELRSATSSDAGARALAKVPESLILAVAGRLQPRVAASVGALQHSALSTTSSTAVAIEAMGCALVLLSFMKIPGSVAVLRVEETCEALIDVLGLVLRRVVFPARDSSFGPPGATKRKRASRPADGYGVDDGSDWDMDEEKAADQSDDEALLEEQPSPRRARGRRRRSSARGVAGGVTPDALLSLCCRVARNWGEVLEVHVGPEEFGSAAAARLVSVLISVLGVSGVAELQLSMCATIGVVFWYYEDARAPVLTELLHFAGRLPSSRSDLRRFRVSGAGGQSSVVRVSSALFLQLVHALGGLADKEVASAGDDTGTRPADVRQRGEDLQLPPLHAAHVQVVVQMQGVVRASVEALVTPALKARDVNALDAVTAFVEDMLELYGLPEWPGADTVVQLLFLHLSDCLQRVSVLKGGAPRSTDVHTRGAAFGWLGSLAARLQAEAALDTVGGLAAPTNACGGDTGGPLPASHCVLKLQYAQCRAAVLAVCHSTPRGGLRLQCSALFWRSQWVVDDSRAALKPEDIGACGDGAAGATSAGRAGQPAACPSAPILHARGENAAVADSTSGTVSAVAASRWLTHRRAVTVRLLDRVLETIMRGFTESMPTVRSQALKAMSMVAGVDPIKVQARTSFVRAIRSCCMDVSVVVRDAALNLLCSIFSSPEDVTDAADAAVGPTESTVLPLHGREAPVVRRFDATFVSSVLPVVAGRLLDTATSVRKRAVRILSQVVADAFSYLLTARRSTTSFESDRRHGDAELLVIDVCAMLLGRLVDSEDSVRHASQFALRAVLFGHASDKGRPGIRAGAQRDDPFAALLAPTDAVAERTRAFILVGTISKVPPAACDKSLEDVIDESLLAARRPLVSRMLSLVVRELLEADLSAMELSIDPPAVVPDGSSAAGDAQMGQVGGHIADGISPASTGSTAGVSGSGGAPSDLQAIAERRVACAQFVSALAAVDAGLVFPHCSVLAPLLKGLDGVPRYQVVVASYVLDTIERVIPGVRPVPSELVGELEEDLSALVCTHPDEQLAAAAIKCLCSITQQGCATNQRPDAVAAPVGHREVVVSAQPDGETASATRDADAVNSVRSAKRVVFRSASPLEAVPVTIARQFYDYLQGNRGQTVVNDPAFVMHACVALVRLGLFCRYAALETSTTTAYYAVLEEFAVASTADWSVRHPLRRAALEGVAHVVMRRRDLLISATRLFAASLRQPGLMCGQADVSTRLRVLDDLYDMLLSESFQTKPSAAPAGGDSPHGERSTAELPVPDDVADVALAMEDDPDAGSLTAAVQSLQLDLVNLAADVDARIRHRVATILDLTVRHGVLLASSLVSPLVGLSADRADVRTSPAALRALDFISTRHPYLLAPRLVDGVSTAFSVAAACAGAHRPSSSVAAAPTETPGDGHRTTCPLVLAVDPLTGYALLSDAFSLLPGARRKAAFESLLKEVHLRSKGAASGAPTLRRSVRSAGPAVSAGVPSAAGLAFVVSTLCSIDFGCIINSMAVSAVDKVAAGGTGSTAADAKTKTGRDEIAFIVATAGRLVSSTGHTLLDAAIEALEADSTDASGGTPLHFLAARSVPLSYLLLLKRHFAASSKDGTAAVAPASPLGLAAQLSGPPRLESPFYKMDPALLSEAADATTWRRQLRVFRDLMDADEAVIAPPGQGAGGTRGRRPRRAAR